MPTPESTLLASVCDYLAYRKHFFWRQNTAPTVQKDATGWRFRRMPNHSMRGVPDIILVRKGQFVGLEVKPKGKYQSPDQKIFEALVKEAGGAYHVIRSIEDLQAIGL